MEPTRKGKLFIITGASGVGKSTASEILFQKEKDYIGMESGSKPKKCRRF